MGNPPLLSLDGLMWAGLVRC